MRTIGLCLLIKNEKDNLEKLLSSVKNQVDWVYLTDTGSTDGSVEEAQRICKKVGLKLETSHFEWVDNFAKARNFNFSQAKTDWILWLDGDDTLEGGESLRKTIDNAELNGVTGIYANYDYQSDENNNNLNDHDKLRVVKNGLYSWTYWGRKPEGEDVSIHENLFALPGTETKDGGTEEFSVIHHISPDGIKDSRERNLRILRKQEVEEGDNPDPRTVFLLGREYDGNGMYEEAIPYLKRFVEMEGTPGETLHACSMLSKIYERKGMFKQQLHWAYRGVEAHPTHPLGYLRIAETYRNMGEWQNVVDAVLLLRTKKVGRMETLAYTDFAINKPADLELANAYTELGKFDEAREVIAKAIKDLTKDEKEYVQPAINQVNYMENTSKLERATRVFANTLIQSEKIEGLLDLLKVVPEPIRHKKAVTDIQRVLGFNKLWNKGNITILARAGIEPWDEDSLKTGIGGSETAVIEMAKRWGNAGYHVTVYGDVNEEKRFDNVRYLPGDQINYSDRFDIFISWRNVQAFKEVDIQANAKYLWLHDVPDPTDFTRTVWEKIDKIIVLSDYHRGLLPDVPDEKIYVSRNGIDTDLMDSLRNKIKRNPKKVIYASQPIRGLEFLLDNWAEIKKANFELVWAYGWDNYDIMIKKGVGSQEFKDRMNDKMEKLGVKQLGRLSKEDLYKEFLSSGIWAYPTTFPEINCIVASEAQYAGCHPISTGIAALAETQLHGDKVSIEEFPKTLAKRLRILPEIRTIDKSIGWNTIAKEWMNDLFYGVEWEDPTPLVSVVFITAREDVFDILKKSINHQTYRNIEVIIVDKLYGQRKDSPEGLNVPYIHLPDPDRDRTKYKYGLCHAHNAALSVATGELMVFLQDNFFVPEDGIEKFVSLYLNHPNKLIAGVDRQYKDSTFTEEVWKSMWIKLGKGRRLSVFAREWEANWAAAPRKILKALGGWNIEWDKGHGWDNVDVAFRFCEAGGQIIVDEDNCVKGIRHENDWQGDPVYSNGERFMSYARAIQESKNPKLTMEFKEPNYPKNIKKLIKNFKHRA